MAIRALRVQGLAVGLLTVAMLALVGNVYGPGSRINRVWRDKHSDLFASTHETAIRDASSNRHAEEGSGLVARSGVPAKPVLGTFPEPIVGPMTLLSFFIDDRARVTFILNMCLYEERDQEACPFARHWAFDELVFECTIRQPGNRSIPGEVIYSREVSDSRLCKGNIIVRCPLSSRKPALVWLIRTGRGARAVWGGAAGLDARPIDSHPLTRTGRDSIAVCTSFTAGFNTVPELLNYLAYHRLQGVSHMYLYDWANFEPDSPAAAAHADFRKAVEPWGRRGFVTVIPWAKDRTGQRICVSEESSYYDCLYRFGTRYEWVSNSHLDELIVPHSLPTLKLALSAVPSDIDEVRMFEHGVTTAPGRAKVDPLAWKSPSQLWKAMANGDLVRPNIPFTRMSREGPGKLTPDQQPFEGILRSSRWMLLNADGGEVLVGGENDPRRNSTTPQNPRYQYWDPNTEVSLFHMSPAWVQGFDPSDGFWGHNFSGVSLSESMYTPGQVEAQPVSFQSMKDFAGRYSACVEQVIAADGFVQRACRTEPP